MEFSISKSLQKFMLPILNKMIFKQHKKMNQFKVKVKYEIGKHEGKKTM